MQLISELITLKEDDHEIVELDTSFASNIEDDSMTMEEGIYEAEMFAYKHGCLAKLNVWIGPSGGWPDFYFWGPRENMASLIKEYTDGDEELYKEYMEEYVRPSTRSWHQPTKPVKPNSLKAKELDKHDFLKNMDMTYKKHDQVQFHWDSDIQTGRVVSNENGKVTVRFHTLDKEKDDYVDQTETIDEHDIIRKV
jgi:hypothetical protein